MQAIVQAIETLAHITGFQRHKDFQAAVKLSMAIVLSWLLLPRLEAVLPPVPPVAHDQSPRVLHRADARSSASCFSPKPGETASPSTTASTHCNLGSAAGCCCGLQSDGLCRLAAAA